MRGKIAFVLGAAVGYVLGSRAGRERYEQIKRGAQHLWATEPVQRGVSAVKGAVDERADTVKVFVARVGADVLSGFAQPKQRTTATRQAASRETEPATAEDAPASEAAEAGSAAKPSKGSTAKPKGSGAKGGSKAAS